MAPPLGLPVARSDGWYRRAESKNATIVDWRAHATDEEFVLESWSQGFMVGALLIMGCVTIANMRRGVALHKLILAEQLLAMSHGTFCFMSFHGYGWYLSSTAAFLYLSWIIHNIVAWMKVRPFFTQPGGFFRQSVGVWVRRIYLGSLALTVPVIIFQISDNFRFFNNRGGWYNGVRPYEPLIRDPWWIFTCVTLFHVIRKCYGTGAVELVKRSPRFGILLVAIGLSIVFTACDIAASITTVIGSAKTSTRGINPWWKLSLVFKCLTDTIMLDDFKTELKRLGIKRIAKEEKRRNSIALVLDQEPKDVYAQDSGTDNDDNSSGGTGRRRNKWYGSHFARQRSRASPSPTKSATINHTRALKNPNANMQELDFHTALALGPTSSSISSISSSSVERKTTAKMDSPSSPQHIEDTSPNGRCGQEREHVNTHTTKISRLPGLGEFRFEAIKPGRKIQKHGHQHDGRDSLELAGDSDDEDDIQRHDDDINDDVIINKKSNAAVTNEDKSRDSKMDTNTDMDMDIEAQLAAGTATSTGKKGERVVRNRDPGGIRAQLQESEDTARRRSAEQRDRERRFRQSIGADGFH